MTTKTEIIYNLINSALAGVLVLLGALTSGHITWEGFGAAAVAAGIVACTQFKKFWEGEEAEFVGNKKGSIKLFGFIK